MHQTGTATLQARILRQSMTPAETALWQALRNRRLLGLKFRRQVPLGPGIAGFYCIERRLAIEADGAAPDARFDSWLAERGIRMLRLTPGQIRADLAGCLRTIASDLSS